MIGGSSSPIGALIGSILINLLPEWLRFLKDYMMLIYGVGIMGLMVVLPEGLVGGGKDLYAKYIKRKRSRVDAEQGL
jgi:branched-chain amino acid transport system permease protein